MTYEFHRTSPGWFELRSKREPAAPAVAVVHRRAIGWVGVDLTRAEKDPLASVTGAGWEALCVQIGARFEHITHATPVRDMPEWNRP